jgi:hypothetical protein
MENPLLELSRQGYQSFTKEELDDRLFQEWPQQRPIAAPHKQQHHHQTTARQPLRPPPKTRHGSGPLNSEDEWPDLEKRKGHRRTRHSGGYTPIQILLGLAAAVVVLSLVGIIIYIVVISVHSDGSTDDSSSGSTAAAGIVQAEVLETVAQSPLEQYHINENSQLGAEAKTIASLSYAFTVGNELQIRERHPANGSLLTIPYDSLRFYTVCCNVKSKNFVCLGGVSYSSPGLSFEASLEYDQKSNEVYLALWVNGKDLLGAGCYAHISYLPP